MKYIGSISPLPGNVKLQMTNTKGIPKVKVSNCKEIIHRIQTLEIQDLFIILLVE